MARDFTLSPAKQFAYEVAKAVVRRAGQERVCSGAQPKQVWGEMTMRERRFDRALGVVYTITANIDNLPARVEIDITISNRAPDRCSYQAVLAWPGQSVQTTIVVGNASQSPQGDISLSSPVYTEPSSAAS